MENNALMMNIHTGSIDTYENWLTEYEARGEEEQHKTFKEWGSGLKEIERNEI